MPPALLVLLVVAFVHGTAWAVVTAPWNGPDEVAHFAYAEHLARTGHAPQRGAGTGSQSTAQNVALFQLNLFPIRLQPGGRPNYSSVPRVKDTLATLPAKDYKDGSGPSSTANYPPLYYAYEAVAYTVSPFRSELGRLFAMRMATVLLFVATVWLAWLIAAELLAVAWAPALAAGLVALQPKAGFEAGIVNPDMMLVVLSTGALLAALRLVTRGFTAGRTVALALTTVAAVLTHPRGYFLPPFAVIAVLLSLWRSRLLKPRPLAIAAGLTVAVGISVGLAMLWTRGHTGGPGDTGGSGNPVGTVDPRQFVSYLWQFYLPKLSFMSPKVGPSFYGYRQVYIESFFGSFASLSVDYRAQFYDLLQVVAAIGVVGLYTTAILRPRAVLAKWPAVVVSAVFFVGLMLLLHIVSYSSLRISNDPVLTGRYLLPAIALYGAAAAWVASSLPRRWGLVVAGALIGGSALLAVGGVGLSLERFYV